MSIQANLKEVLSELPAGVRLVAVSKFHPNEALEEAYAAGQRIFGESHVQEMTQKYETLPKDIEWHFIGHLQTKSIASSLVYCRYISPKRKRSSVSLLTNAGKCWIQADGRI